MEELKNKESKYLKIIDVIKAVLVPLVNFFVFFTINFVVQFCFSFIFTILTADENLSITEHVAKAEKMFNKYTSLIYIVLSIVYLTIYVLLQRKIKFSRIIDLEYKKIKFAVAVLSAALGMFIGIFSNVGLTLLSNNLPESWIEGNRENVSAFQGGNPIVMLIAVVVFAPIVEELLFRGVIYNAIKKIFKVLIKNTSKKTHYCTVIFAAVITSFLFGVYHGNILQALYAGVLSLLMIWVYELSGSIFASMLVHGMFNFSGAPAYQMLVLFGENGTLTACVIIVCVSMAMIYIECKKEK